MDENNKTQNKYQRLAIDVDSFYLQLSRCLSNRYSSNLIESTNTFQTIDIVVAFSGGVDSVVLLDLLHRTKPSLQRSSGKDVFIRPVYVNHHLQPQADDWQAFCINQAQKYQLSCQVLDIFLSDTSRNVESQARQLRYQALATTLQNHSVLITGHHANDQLETFFINLMRGSGIDGLSAMPLCRDFNESFLLRPLLPFSKDQIISYAQTRQLQWINDSSNDDSVYDRNFLRHQVLPSLNQRWPNTHQHIAQSIEHLQDVRLVMNDYLAESLSAIALTSNNISSNIENISNVLNINKFIDFSVAKRRLILRHWFRASLQHVSLSQLADVDSSLSGGHLISLLNFIDNYLIFKYEVCENKQAPSIKLMIGKVAIVNYCHELYLLPSDLCTNNQNDNVNKSHGAIKALFDQAIMLNDYVEISFKSLKKNANSLSEFGLLLNDQCHSLQWRYRQGGEQFISKDGSSKSLKKIWQEEKLPSWEKSFIPLLYVNEQIIWAAGITMTEKRAAAINKLAGQSFWQFNKGVKPLVSFVSGSS